MATWPFLSDTHRPFIPGIRDVGLPHVIPRNSSTSSTEKSRWLFSVGGGPSQDSSPLFAFMSSYRHSTLRTRARLLVRGRCSASLATLSSSPACSSLRYSRREAETKAHQSMNYVIAI